MNTSHKFYFAAILLLFSQPVFSTNYYLSAAGNDINSGTTIKSAWKTIARLNRQKLQPGDSVLFKKGDAFFGELVCNASGTKENSIVYSSYGNGLMPILRGATTTNMFRLFKNDIYMADINESVKAVFMNNQLQMLARFPNTGFRIMEGGIGNAVSFYDSSLTQPNQFWNGANIRFRTFDWEMRTSIVKNFNNHQILIEDSSTNILGKGWGYYFDNKFEALDTSGEWFYSNTDKKLYLCATAKKIKEATIQLVQLKTGITVAESISYVQIIGIQVEKYFERGIYLAGNNKGIILQNNRVESIDHTGIFVNRVSSNCSIINNSIQHINGRGIFALEPNHLSIEQNTIQNIGTILGYGVSGVNGMIGITIANTEAIKSENTYIANNNSIRNNTVRNTGYVGIRMDGAFSTMEYNIVDNVMNQLSDGAAIYCWSRSKYYTHDNTIKKNIISNISGSNFGTPSGPNPAANGIYIDNGCYNILVDSNLIYNVSASGIHVNSEAFDNLISNNTLFNCQTGLSVAEWSKPKSTFGNKFLKNKIFIRGAKDRAVVLINFLLPGTQDMATFDQNTYYHLYGDTLMTDIYNIKSADGAVNRITNEYGFEAWKKEFKYELSGKTINAIAGINSTFKPLLFTNPSLKMNNQIFAKGKYINLMGKPVNRVQIPPFQSIIVFKTNP
ncbi:MAG: right-handed parallel beta-helix repeat-containing protein [Sphingobacteriia bacterium]|nr:MAG: right-handed parallel beta-helix repeat-containing protein [Sphingobacteriia bacterium]